MSTYLYGGWYQNPYAMLNDPSQQTQNIASMVNVGLQQQQMSLTNSILLDDLEHQFNKMLYSIPTQCCISTDTPKKTNCCNCGAPLSGKHLCAYCSTYNK
jgi:hypothetical protein